MSGSDPIRTISADAHRGVDRDAALNMLADLRLGAGQRLTEGLSPSLVERALSADPRLGEAVSRAHAEHERMRLEAPELLGLSEAEQIERVQSGILSFYPGEDRSPYVAAGAAGPWVVTLKGAVVYDCGGYGMLGLGHAPPLVLEALGRASVMANVMTPSASQWRLLRRLRREIGHTRAACPYDAFVFLNSGSEAMGLGALLADANAKRATDVGGHRAGQRICGLSLLGSFHGRTHRAAGYSHSTQSVYRSELASFRDRPEDALLTIPPNDVAALRQAFAAAEREGVFIESLFLEPVLGEGDPGLALTPEFYAEARERTSAHGSLLLVDSIQAGLRCYGVLSVCDFPGFEGVAPPDAEVYSKALNAGQFPLSVLALTEWAAGLYPVGTYGNTMTTSPRALEVASAVLDGVTPWLRGNMRSRGEQLLDGLRAMRRRLEGTALEGCIVDVQGCGLLVSAALAPGRLRSHGVGSVEEAMRRRGVNVIHGGKNSLRFTPVFDMSEEQVELVLGVVWDALWEVAAEV